MAGEPERAGGSADAALPAAAAPLPCQKQFGPLESIDPNDAMILPHGANPDRMKFSERTGSMVLPSRAGYGLMGIRNKPIAPRLALAERLRRTLDRVDASRAHRSCGRIGRGHLRRMLQCYARYYNEIRTHRSLDKDAPLSRPVQRIGRIMSHALLGGLHHLCVRI